VLVVLDDDDPTGTQTCHDISVLTVWDEETLRDEFESECAGFFILTNSRALPPTEARLLVKEICRAVKHAAAEAGKTFEIVLRGDSTLRGHFPDEPEAAEEILGEADMWILAPFFEQGARLTIEDTHDVASPDGQLIPAAQTPFAKDAPFAYTQSNLRQHIRSPLWQYREATAKFPGLPYVVFPGNVGERDTLRDLVARWAKSKNRDSFQPMQYQRLGSSGLKVSRLILGCMTFGNPNWEGSPWILPEEQALPLLKKAYDQGISTWETANSYSNGESERIIGKALRTYDIPRSKVVLMTKLYYPVLEGSHRRPQPASNDGELVNQMGLSRKHIFDAVEGSLRRLGTSYIDVLQLHRLDNDTRPEEVMEALHDLVKMGKVHYIGASSMSCWQFARLQYTAKMHHWTTFTSMSGLYNLLYREEEREMIPFCEAEGVGLIPWSPVARGLLTRPWSEQTDRSKKDVKTARWFQGDQNEIIVSRVEKLAKSKHCSMSSLALAWLMHKNACPIVGLNSISRIEAVSEALGINLTAADMRFLEEKYQPLAPQAM
ncbi:uncharacterized protein MYCFIDRAFT_107282, partial [Pseudocercospora fijiensis CIRAD86]